MPLRFLLDEHLRGGSLWYAIQRHNVGSGYPIDTVRVGDPPNLPLGSTDATILQWGENEGRILISRDLRTLPGHLAIHLQTGHHSPGLLSIRRGSTITQLLFYLELAAYAADPAAYQDLITYIP
jgi:hypothetical protein